MMTYQNLFDGYSKGMALGELKLFSSGRQTGKSNYTVTILKARQAVQRFTLLTSRVDDAGVTWHTVEIPVFEVLEWIWLQDDSMYSELKKDKWPYSQYEIHEQLFTIMALRWL